MSRDEVYEGFAQWEKNAEGLAIVLERTSEHRSSRRRQMKDAR